MYNTIFYLLSKPGKKVITKIKMKAEKVSLKRSKLA